jgi:hypothetical protein
MKNYDKKTVFIEPYKDLAFDGNLYIMTSVSTYSATMTFAELILDNSLGKMVGEIPDSECDARDALEECYELILHKSSSTKTQKRL